MVDDEDGKIRRNLVAVSTVILLLAWLDVPLATVAGRLLGEKPEAGIVVSLSPVRVWLAIAALLVYFALRFKFSGEGTQATLALDQAWQRQYTKVISRHIRNMSRKATARTLRPGQLHDEVLRVARKMGVSNDLIGRLDAHWPKFVFQFEGGAQPSMGLDLNLSAYVVWLPTGNEDHSIATTEKIRYSMSRATNKRLRWEARLRAGAYSDGSMAKVWPWTLAIAAATVTAWKLGRAVTGW